MQAEAVLENRGGSGYMVCLHSRIDCLANPVRVCNREYTHHFIVVDYGFVYDPIHFVMHMPIREYLEEGVRCKDLVLTSFTKKAPKFDKCPKRCKGCLRGGR